MAKKRWAACEGHEDFIKGVDAVCYAALVLRAERGNVVWVFDVDMMAEEG